MSCPEIGLHIKPEYCKLILGWNLSKTLHASFTIEALRMAMRHVNCDLTGLIHHSDRGCQYCSEAYVKLLQDNGIEISMTQTGDPRDNPIAELVKHMEKTGAKAYLFNTGWNGTGKRISIKDTRGIIDAILDGSIDKAHTKTIPYFDFTVPTELPGVDPNILDPRDTYSDASEWDKKAKDLAGRFIDNFKKFESNASGKEIAKPAQNSKI